MTVRVTKPEINVREKLTELSADKIRFEQGEFTPYIMDNSGNIASPAISYGSYQLVGSVCWVTIDLRNINSSGLVGTDQLRINGLPFKAARNSSALPSTQVLNLKVQNGVAWSASKGSAGTHLIAQIGSGSDVVTLGYNESGDTSFYGVIINDINGGTNRDIWITGSYRILG